MNRGMVLGTSIKKSLGWSIRRINNIFLVSLEYILPSVRNLYGLIERIGGKGIRLVYRLFTVKDRVKFIYPTFATD